MNYVQGPFPAVTQEASNSDKLQKFIDNYKSASADTRREIKSRLEADAAFGNFIKNFRNADAATQKKIVDNIVNASEDTASTFVGALRKALGSTSNGGKKIIDTVPNESAKTKDIEEWISNHSPESFGPIPQGDGQSRGSLSDGGNSNSDANESARNIIKEWQRKHSGGDVLVVPNSKSQEIQNIQDWMGAHTPESLREQLGEYGGQPQDAPGTISVSPDGNEFEYTYAEGDTFGDVLKKLGLSNDDSLWGKGGDAEYYAEQLREQGLSGNIPVGTTIRLRRRR